MHLKKNLVDFMKYLSKRALRFRKKGNGRRTNGSGNLGWRRNWFEGEKPMVDELNQMLQECTHIKTMRMFGLGEEGRKEYIVRSAYNNI